MNRDFDAARAASRAELQGFGTCAALLLEGYFLLLLAEPRNAPFMAVLFLASAWRLLCVRRGGGALVDWSLTPHRVVGSITFLCLGFGSAAAFTGELVHFLAAVVAWVEVLVLLSRWRGPGVLRALAYLSLLHVVLAAFVVRPAATAPLLLVYLFLVVRTLGVADRRVGEVPEHGRFLAMDGGTFAAVSVGAMILFLLVPRPALSGFWGRPTGPEDRPVIESYSAPGPGSGTGTLGFSEQMELEPVLQELLKDKRLALRVGDLDLPPQRGFREVLPELRLRGISFDVFRDGAWQRSGGWDRDDGAVDGFVRTPDDSFGPDPSLPPLGATGAAHLTWGALIRLEPLGTRCVFVPPGVRAIAQEWLLADGEEGFFFALPPTGQVAYRVEAVLLENHRRDEARVRRYPEDAPYLSRPGTGDRFRLLAQDLILDRSGDLERILAIRDHFLRRGGFTYSLTVPPPPEGEDPIEDFVFTGKSGYCVHFATSMALLLRSIGIPCRVAGGYVSSEWDERRQEFLVRQSHAHAWVEVPFEGLGWVPFDPTPLPAGLEEEGLGDVLPRTAERPGFLWTFLFQLERFDRGRFLHDLAETVSRWVRLALGGSGGAGALAAWGSVLAVCLGAWFGTVWLRRRGWLPRLRRGNSPLSGPAAPGVPFYRDLLRLVARRGLIRSPAETPAEFARRVDPGPGDGPAQSIVRAYYRVAFGGRVLAAGEAAEVRAALAAVARGSDPAR